MDEDKGKREAVTPGERLATSEEYIAGTGTYEADGVIYAGRTGFMVMDPRERTVSVVRDGPEIGPPAKGDVVVGMVASLKSAMALVEIFHDVTNPRAIVTEDYAVLHISKVEQGYLKDFSNSLAPGDLIKAVVIEEHPEIRLRTNSPELGVIRAQCPTCGGGLRPKDRGLECPACEKELRRKVSRDFMTAGDS
ncbi:MAG: exosome complex RNA-binding protein Csl4 [Thermoplasmata archaeon]|nr:exosome complex RNA-binding protein Csl4 [Thermoplasmata archaeon]